MWKTIKIALITVAICGVLALYFFRDSIEPGTLLAGLATFLAALKSRIFGESIARTGNELSLHIDDIESKHTVKRDEWNAVQEKYNAEIDALRARMTYHDYRSALISGMITNLDKEELQAMEKIRMMSDEEVLEKLRASFAKGMEDEVLLR